MGSRWNLLAKTSPNNATSKENVAPGVRPGGAGVNPTVALQMTYRVELADKNGAIRAKAD